jgi:hypothetical protein
MFTKGSLHRRSHRGFKKLAAIKSMQYGVNGVSTKRSSSSLIEQLYTINVDGSPHSTSIIASQISLFGIESWVIIWKPTWRTILEQNDQTLRNSNASLSQNGTRICLDGLLQTRKTFEISIISPLNRTHGNLLVVNGEVVME